MYSISYLTNKNIPCDPLQPHTTINLRFHLLWLREIPRRVLKYHLSSYKTLRESRCWCCFNARGLWSAVVIKDIWPAYPFIPGGKSRADTTQQEAGGSQREGERKPRKTENALWEGGGEVRRAEMEKGRSGREKRTGYNRSHMADLKRLPLIITEL